MSDLQAIADRVEIEALRGEFTDAVMMHDYDRLASLFTQDGTVRLPHAYAGAVGREDMRAGGEQLQALLDYMVQATHPGTIVLDGDTASGRALMSELTRFSRWQVRAELWHLPRPLPAHFGRLEVHRARLRDQIPRRHPARGLGTPSGRGRRQPIDMPAAPRSCLHTYGGQDGGRDLYRGLQHHPAGLERDYEQEFIAGHGHTQIGQLCADLRRTCHGAAAAHSGGYGS